MRDFFDIYMETIRKSIAIGYSFVIILIGCIGYVWYKEWLDIETLETENRQINALRMEIHNVYM